MARLKSKQKKNRAALAALGHKTITSAVEEIRRSMPNFDRKLNYPKVKGICPPLADIVLHVRETKKLEFDHLTGFVSNNQREREAHGFSRSREDRFPKCGQPWHICG